MPNLMLTEDEFNERLDRAWAAYWAVVNAVIEDQRVRLYGCPEWN